METKQQFPKPPGIAAGFKQAEAFCLMQYGCEKCHRGVVFYNARDAVTPFMCSCVFDCGGEMKHVNWELDRCVPDHVPRPGDWVWISISPDLAGVFAKIRLKSAEGSKYEPPAAGTPERKDLEERLAKDFLGDGKQPMAYRIPIR